LPQVDLSDPAQVAQYTRDYQLLAMLKQPVNGGPHLKDPTLPDNANESLAILGNVLNYMQSLSSKANRGLGLTLSNYADALVGYKGTNTYLADCASGGAGGSESSSIAMHLICSTLREWALHLSTRSSLTVPSTILVIAIAAFAAYAFAWLDFRVGNGCLHCLSDCKLCRFK